MKNNMKSKLRFIDYIVNNIEFKNNMEFDNSKEVKIEFDIDSEIEFVDDKKFMLGLEIELFKNPEENNYPFSFKAEIIGTFEIDSDDENEKKNLAEKNSVAILFPYVRALISTFTSASNVEPVILPPINVAQYLENKRRIQIQKE